MPKQTQITFNYIQPYVPVISNPDIAIASNYFNTVLLGEDSIRSRMSPYGPDIYTTNCPAQVNAKLQQVLDIWKKHIEDANAAREAAMKGAFIDFLMSLLGLDLIREFNELIAELFRSTNSEVFTPAIAIVGGMGSFDGFPDPYSNRYNHYQPGALRWPNGVMVDGQWIPGPNPPSRPGYPGWIPPQTNPNSQPPKPPVMDRGVVELGKTNPLAWKQWIENNWSKIFGKIAIKSLSELLRKLLTRLGILGLVNLVAQITALLYLLAQLDAIFQQELDRAIKEMEQAKEWAKRALACCSRAQGCGKSGQGCYEKGVKEEPEDGCNS